MGRALFSQKYTSTPAVHEEPDPAAALDVSCERWTIWNQFDPDSEDFFRDAQLEHFVDSPIDSPTGGNSVDEAPHVVVLESDRDTNSSPSTVSSNGNDSIDTPMALRADDPASLLADAYTPVDWQQHFLEAGSDPRRQGRPTRISHRGPRRIVTSRQYTSSDSNAHLRGSPVSVFIPPAPYRTPTSAATTVSPAVIAPVRAQEAPPSSAPRSPVSRRTVSITPINIPSEPSLPSPISPSTPTAPAPNVTYPTTNNNLITPSPAPNTTPRIYTWSRFPGVSSSPTRDSPLTNPHARLSVGGIDPFSMPMAQRPYNTPVAVYDRS